LVLLPKKGRERAFLFCKMAVNMCYSFSIEPVTFTISKHFEACRATCGKQQLEFAASQRVGGREGGERGERERERRKKEIKNKRKKERKSHEKTGRTQKETIIRK